MLINSLEIQNFIPQRAPFVMIDQLIDASEGKFSSEFSILSSNIFLDGSSLSESAVIENIAQTCAAGFGYLGSQKGEEAGKLGFIGAVTKLEVFKDAKLGDVLNTSIEVLNSFDNIHLIQGVSKVGNNTILSCQMKIVVG